MTLFLDKRAGSSALKPYLRALNVDVEDGIYDADVEFLCELEDGPAVAGVEYKTVSDCLTAMSDGRLTGTQLSIMARSYPRRYLLIEGPTRVSSDGVLETKEFDPAIRQYVWRGARGRAGEGWTAREFWGRLSSIEEFFGVRVYRSFDRAESAAWIVGLYHYWQKPYHEHSSYQQWDQSGDSGPRLNAANLLIPTSELPLVQRCARELAGIGQGKAGYVAQHFKTLAEMALADAAEWRKVGWTEKLRTKSRYRRKKFSAETVRKIMAEIWGAPK